MDQLSRIISMKKETLQQIISAEPSTEASNKNKNKHTSLPLRTAETSPLSSRTKNTDNVSPLDAASTSNSSSHPKARLSFEVHKI